jgi:DNA (cytosine-5)-methyltransferase 1
VQRRFVHDKALSTFLSIDEQQHMTSSHTPPDNCFTSLLLEENAHKHVYTQLRNSQGIITGVAFGGHNYHLEDFVLYRSEDDGPAHIGYITNISFPIRETLRSYPKIYMRCVGRINTILAAMPFDMIKDEVNIQSTFLV